MGSLFSFFCGVVVLHRGSDEPRHPLSQRLLVPAILKVVFSTVFVVASNVFIKGNVNDSTLTTIGVATPLFLVGAKITLVFNVNTSIMTSVRLSRKGMGITHVGVARTMIISSLLLVTCTTIVLYGIRGVTLLLKDSPHLLPLTARCVR